VLEPEFEKYSKGAWRPAVAEGRAVQVDASLPYSQWFKERSTAFQNEYLGPLRYRLFRDRGLELIDLVDAAGHPLSYAELLLRFPPSGV
jgi:hypothetical protein